MPIESRNKLKLNLITYTALSTCNPSYLSDLLHFENPQLIGMFNINLVLVGYFYDNEISVVAASQNSTDLHTGGIFWNSIYSIYVNTIVIMAIHTWGRKHNMVPWIWKGVKWQVHPLISKGTIYGLEGLTYELAPCGGDCDADNNCHDDSSNSSAIKDVNVTVIAPHNVMRVVCW